MFGTRWKAGKLTPTTGQRHSIPWFEVLSDSDVNALNHLLPWQCFTLDSKGRMFGAPASASKRSNAQIIPDRRLVELSKLIDLTNETVLEVGCFEGIHTIALCRMSRSVVAIDARIENVVKTIVRCAFYGYSPSVRAINLDNRVDLASLHCDICVHIGVLYHLINPSTHLLDLGRGIRKAIFLDTHYALDDEAIEFDIATGLHFKKYLEPGRSAPFAGMSDHSKWLRLIDIRSLLTEAGFHQVDILDTRTERNGPRASILATR